MTLFNWTWGCNTGISVMWWINCFPNTLKAGIQTFFHSIAKLTAINLSDPIIHLKHSSLIKSAHLPVRVHGGERARGRGVRRGGGCTSLPPKSGVQGWKRALSGWTWKMSFSRQCRVRNSAGVRPSVGQPLCPSLSWVPAPSRQRRSAKVLDAVRLDRVLLLPCGCGFVFLLCFFFCFFLIVCWCFQSLETKSDVLTVLLTMLKWN